MRPSSLVPMVTSTATSIATLLSACLALAGCAGDTPPATRSLTQRLAGRYVDPLTPGVQFVLGFPAGGHVTWTFTTSGGATLRQEGTYTVRGDTAVARVSDRAQPDSATTLRLVARGDSLDVLSPGTGELRRKTYVRTGPPPR